MITFIWVTNDMFDILQGLKNKCFLIELPSHLWRNIDPYVLRVVKGGEWKTFKFYTDDHKRSHELRNISNITGGVYVFYITPDVIPENHRILMYIGRARLTENQNLRKRISEYYGYAPPNDERPKLADMFKEWWEDVYCSYLELSCANEEIDHIEAELINKLLPHCNDAIPDTKIGKAVKAAGLQ